MQSDLSGDDLDEDEAQLGEQPGQEVLLPFDEEHFRIAIEYSIADDARLAAAADSIHELARTAYGRVENPKIRRDGGCMMDAARDQIVTVDPSLGHLTDSRIRADCITWVHEKYGETGVDTLTADGRYTGWADWEQQMSRDTHFGDELMMEAIASLYGGFNIKIVIGSHEGPARIRSSGFDARPTLYFGLQLDLHVWSLQLPNAVVTLAPAVVAVAPAQRLAVVAPPAATSVVGAAARKRGHFEFVGPRVGLPCCGQAHIGSGLNAQHSCSLCGRVEHVHCAKTKISRRIAWMCTECSSK